MAQTSQRKRGLKMHTLIGTVGETKFTKEQTWKIKSAIGQILPVDHGKRVYEIDGIYQVENNEQRDKRSRSPGNIYTTNKKSFTHLQTVAMARLVYLRFGENISDATIAWRRLLQNNCSERQFAELIHYPEHTEACQGWCINLEKQNGQ